jgi:hypothetical protein
MLKCNITMHRKKPGYEIKAILTITGSSSGFSSAEVNQSKNNDQLEMLKEKLEYIIPGSMRAKYNLSSDKLVVSVPCKDAAESLRVTRKMEDHVKNAATQLNIK